MRYGLLVLLLGGCFTGIGVIFWKQELQYSLPTAIPSDYKIVPVGQRVEWLSDGSAALPQGPAFLHFYNPDCPCSRFNARHIKSLIRSYGSSIKLIVVVPSEDAKSKAVGEFGNHLEYVTDSKQVIAKSYGVYSTPQAVIIDQENKLFFRGNYNKSRYCTTKASNYAELALVALLNNQEPPVFDLFATQSYGCELPQHQKQTSFTFDLF